MRIKNINVPYSVLILLIMGSLLLLVGLYDAFRVYLSSSWPSVIGQIEHSEVLEKELSRHDTVYYLSVKYRYQVKGQEYEGRRVSYGDAMGADDKSDPVHRIRDFIFSFLTPTGQLPYGDTVRSTIEPFAEKYHSGKEIRVHYHPDDPSFAVINTEIEWANTRQLIWAFLCFVVAAFIAVFRWVKGFMKE